MRNDSGSWATLQHITFQNNIVRNTGTGVLILGIDHAGPSVQGFDIKILNNVFDKLTAEWGDQFGTWLRANRINDLVVDHNTIIQNFWLVAMEGPVIVGSKMTGFLQFRGSSIKVFIDGVERMSVTDSTIMGAGRAGVYTGTYTNTDTLGIHIDNFSATNAP